MQRESPCNYKDMVDENMISTTTAPARARRDNY